MNTSEFERRTSHAGRPVIVDFWAPWCAPCRMTKPTLDKLALEYSGKVDFLPVNADDSREVLQHFRVAGIPTVLAFRDGKLAARVTGARDEAGYRSMFEALASGNEVKVPVAAFDRMIRLGAGALLVMAGVYISSWLLVGAGAIVTFLGVYDRCPVWAALTRFVRQLRSSQSPD